MPDDGHLPGRRRQRLVASTTVTASLWGEEDRAKAIALQRVEDDTCPGCGNALSETTQMDLRTVWQADKEACGGCMAKAGKTDGIEPYEFVVVTRRE